MGQRLSVEELGVKRIEKKDVVPPVHCARAKLNKKCEPDEEYVIINMDVRHRSVSVDGPVRKKSKPLPLIQPQRDNMFLAACKKSYVTFDARNIIVIGQTGSGKSSTVCNLLGQCLPTSPSSTDLIKVIPNVYWQSKKSNRLRQVNSDNEIKIISQSILKQAIRMDEFKHLDLLHVPSSDESTASWPSKGGSSNCSSFTLLESVKMAVTKEVTKAHLQGNSIPQPQQESVMLYQVIDCGGMPFFRNLLPQFFPSAANTIFFLVHNVTNKLNSKAQVRVLNQGRLVHQEELPFSNMEEISSWMKIAHSCTSAVSKRGHVGNTFLISTHYDCLQEICFKNELLAAEAATEATKHICDQVGSYPYHSVLDPDPVFLNNKKAGCDSCPGILKLRKKLWSYSPISKPITMPILWVTLIKHIRELATEHNQPVLSLAHYLEIASSYHLSEDDAFNVLQKCQELCLVFRLSNSSYLSKYIFTDMQWLFHSLAGILHRPDTYCKQGKYYQDWKHLIESGFMSVEFHTHLFFFTPQVNCLQSTWASDLLEHLHLMARVTLEEGSGYFCPILLPSVPTKTDSKDPFHVNDNTDALYIIPPNKSLPAGLLARLFTVIAIQKNVQLSFCSSQTSATFQLFGSHPDESYFLRISEEKGGIKLEFCNAYCNRLETIHACKIANQILAMIVNAVDVLKSVWEVIPSLECPVYHCGGTKSFPSLFVECRDPRCNSKHLSRIFPQPLNKARPYVQCCLTQRLQFFAVLPISQMIWLMKLVEDKSEVELMKKRIVCEINYDISDSSYTLGPSHRDLHTYPFPFLVQDRETEFRKMKSNAFTAYNDKRKYKIAEQPPVPQMVQPDPHSLYTIDDGLQLPYILDRHLMLLDDHLDLDICTYLYQYGVLNNDLRSNICELTSPDSHTLTRHPSQPSNRQMALRILVDELKVNGNHGFMGLISALESTSNPSNRMCSHRIILESLEKDRDFIKIKKKWLSSLTVD